MGDDEGAQPGAEAVTPSSRVAASGTATTTVGHPIVAMTEASNAGSTRASKQFGMALVAIALVGLAIRIGAAIWYDRNTLVHGDAFWYTNVGQHLAEGKGFIQPLGEYSFHRRIPSAAHPPAYAVYLSLISHVDTTSMTWRLWSTLPGVGTVVLLGVLGRDLASDRAGLLAAALGTVFLDLVVQDVLLWSEGMFAFTIVLTVWLAYRYVRAPSTHAPALLGGAIALAALHGAEGVLLLVILLLPLALRARAIPLAPSARVRRDRRPRRADPVHTVVRVQRRPVPAARVPLDRFGCARRLVELPGHLSRAWARLVGRALRPRRQGLDRQRRVGAGERPAARGSALRGGRRGPLADRDPGAPPPPRSASTSRSATPAATWPSRAGTATSQPGSHRSSTGSCSHSGWRDSWCWHAGMCRSCRSSPRSPPSWSSRSSGTGRSAGSGSPSTRSCLHSRRCRSTPCGPGDRYVGPRAATPTCGCLVRLNRRARVSVLSAREPHTVGAASALL